MSYADYSTYAEIYTDGIPNADYDRYAWEADRVIDRETTGVDGVRKLGVAMPTDDYALACVQRCACAVADALYRIDLAQAQAAAMSGTVTRDDGTITSAVVASASSGSESISYATGNNAVIASAYTAAAKDLAEKRRLLRGLVTDYLSGVEDANGVNLLYMGVYPCVP